MKPNIEDQINKALSSVKNTEPVELPYGFSDKVINRLHAKEAKVRSIFTISPLIRVAAVFVLILINIFTIKLALSPQPATNVSQFATINDFVNEYQINDTNEEVVTINTPGHE